jgi:phosphogluconate dehydratase
MTMHSRVVEVTERLAARSAVPRAAYLQHIRRAARQGPYRSALSCSNLAHGFAACTDHDKDALMGSVANIAFVSSYNDMLSDHQPFESFPAVI